MQDSLLFLIPLGFLVVFPLFWMAIVFLISRMTGWARMARRFGVSSDRKFSGEGFGWSSAQFNLLGGYSNCLDIVVSRHGIYIRPVWLFRIGHEPLLIPWAAIAGIEVGRRMFLTIAKVAIRPEGHGGASSAVWFSGKRLAESIERNKAK